MIRGGNFRLKKNRRNAQKQGRRTAFSGPRVPSGGGNNNLQGTSISFLTGPRHQIIPDRFFCTMECSELGHYAASAAAGQSWNFPLSCIAHPFNQVNSGAAIPNPLVAVATLSPAGLVNLLFNSITSTGLWNFYRVWRCRYELNVQPTNGADDTIAVVSPVQGTSSPTFTNILVAQDSPGSRKVICSQANPTRKNTVMGTVDLPGFLGISNAAYSAMTTNTYGSYTNLPVEAAFANVTTNTMSDATYTALCPIHATLRWDVEFFNRADAALLDDFETRKPPKIVVEEDEKVPAYVRVEMPKSASAAAAVKRK